MLKKENKYLGINEKGDYQLKYVSINESNRFQKLKLQ